MTRGALAFAAVLALAAVRSADAQNVLMNSAETINKGNFKLSAFPTILFGEDNADDDWGLASRFGYGFSDSFDAEVKLAFFDGLTFYGVDGEYWFVKGELDVSAALGIHRSELEGDRDLTGIDTALLLSGNVADKLELYGGLNLSFESGENDQDFTRAYLVPGIEYRVAENLDLLAEFGLGLNDDTRNYLSFGLALYIR
jgi:hypothetical protein